MPFGIGSLTATARQALTPLDRLSQDLLATYRAASSGKRIGSAADDPSGLAIAQTLTAQAAGFDQGTRNAFDARNALSVAEGALQTTTDALQSLRSLAVQASNDLLGPAQRRDLQGVANQLVAQINTDAQNANFNGRPLLDGSTPATAATAIVTSNAGLSGGGTLVASATPSNGAQGGTITASVVSAGGSTGIDVTFTDTQTGTTSDLGVQAAGATLTVNGTTITLGTPASVDVGQTATVQVNAANAGTSSAPLGVQTGAAEGATTGVTLPNGGSAGLLLHNVDLSSSASATNAIGQIDQALQTATAARAEIGAQTVSLGQQANANATASNALTASASAIADANAGRTSTELYKLLVQQRVSLATLQNANAQFGFLNRFFNTAA